MSGFGHVLFSFCFQDGDTCSQTWAPTYNIVEGDFEFLVFWLLLPHAETTDMSVSSIMGLVGLEQHAC